MGLGKTLQTLSFLGYLKFLRNIHGPFLMVVPKSTLQNWLNETTRWIPKFRAFILHGSKENRQEIIRTRLLSEGSYDICITSYEMCLLEKASIRKILWEYLVIDEAHRIKNEHSMLSQIVRGFNSRNRLLITGTPLQNNLHELWALLNYLLPDVFSSAEDFDEWFRIHGEQAQDQMLNHLKALLQPFLLRRLKQDVEHSLLPKKEVHLYVGMSDMQRQWYRRILEKDIEAVNGLTKGREGTTRLLNIVMQLRKCCNHPYLFDGAEPGPPYTTDIHLVDNAAKMVVLDKLLARLKANGSRVLLFSQMSRMLDIFEDYCGWRGFEYCRIDGQTPHEDRISAIDEYNRKGSEKFIFLLTTRAGGLGINLATADIVILYDSDWNPQVDLQAQDRAHRIGQTKQVVVFRMLTEHSVEEKVIERALQKLRLDQLVIQQGKLANANRPLGRDEMLGMIRFGAEKVLSSSKAEKSNEDSIDIEGILRKGEERTKEMLNKFKNAGFEDLLSGAASSSVYEWEGEDYATSGQPTNRRFIELAKRERKANYAVDYYYREALRVHPKADKPARAPVPKSCIIHDYQFFSEELKPLLESTILFHQKSLGYKLNDNDIADPEERKLQQRKIDSAEPLTPKEEKRKKELMDAGFPDWHKKDFYAFVRGCERFGRKASLPYIAEELGKPLEDVKRYSKAFWANLDSLPDGHKIQAGIEKGEQRIERAGEIQKMLSAFIARNPASQPLKFNYYGSKSRNYTLQEDDFIVRTLADLGYSREDAYDELVKKISHDKLFRFDWFMRTRTPQDLAQRASRLVSFIERDVLSSSKKAQSASGNKGHGKASKKKKVKTK
jgi:superfamily II DNA or RNA helicase